MLKIETIENGILLTYFNRTIGFLPDEYQTFKDNLIVDYTERKWFNDKWIEIPYSSKINVEDIDFSIFNCLYHKHEPNYNCDERKKLNIRYLLTKCNWVCG